MLKKIASLACAALTMLALAPSQEAVAWDRVCMHLPLWKTWFLGRIHVVSDFEPRAGKVPAIFDDPYLGEVRLPGSLNGDPGAPRAKRRVQSGEFPANQSRCVDIRRGVNGSVPMGTAFFVYMQAAGGKAVLCKTHHSNPNPWYIQQERPYQELWYKAWGTTGHPRCEFTHER